MQHSRVVLVFAALCVCLPLRPATADVTGPGGKVQDCYCTDKGGARVELGEFRCLAVDGRMFMAQCQMSLNVPMWREVQAECPSAALHLPPAPALLPPQQSVPAAGLPRL